MTDRDFARAKAAARSDPFFVYRPLLDLLGKSEGTDKGDGYNETLAYGAFTGGNVNLVSMTLSQVDALQTKMLKHPGNKLNSSAAGRYQIVRTTLRAIRKTLGLGGDLIFDRRMQDRMACYLLGVRGIDKWLAGRLSTATLLSNLAHEWASLPLPNGKGAYGGQHAAVTVAEVTAALAEVRKRHLGQAPAREVVPPEVEKEVKKKTGLWGWLTGLGGGLGTGVAGLIGMDWKTVAIIAGAAVVLLVVIVILRSQIAGAVREIGDAVEGK
ncbi:hypothetical protein CSC94_12815 [Zhengella mangrovi]|uniref:Glycoside hydrolase family 104 protein n=1 Tax=Zhengella mangrovi TaxID=1982044 RepID=A0A2G1QM04_9HYPH|nr:hypothetical protein [Zhengella mangrovi]PHP66565.1 hypothetical protein CSC94_12815 [Zhengella mangrovi]